jgi:hypothetical protein
LVILEEQALRLAENAHLFYNTTFLEALHTFPTSSIANKIFEVLKFQNLSDYYGGEWKRNQTQNNNIEHYIIILCLSQKPEVYNYLVKLYGQRNDVHSEYRKFILKHLLIYFHSQTEHWILQRLAAKSDDWDIKRDFLDYLNDYEDHPTG